MALTAQDVENQLFRQEFRGYNQEEVDTFLEQVAASLRELTAERDQLAQRLTERDQRGGDEEGEAERILRRTLIAAERTAEEVVREARGEAEQLREEARQESEQQLTEASAEAERLRTEASAESERVKTESAREAELQHEATRAAAERIREATEELRRFRDDYRERVQAVVTEQLAVLDRITELPEVSADLQDLARQVSETPAQPAR
ncbi:MAG: DivIVA domain-containing protein [Egibacteraceae bacterium]